MCTSINETSFVGSERGLFSLLFCSSSRLNFTFESFYVVTHIRGRGPGVYQSIQDALYFFFILTENKLKINKSMHDQMIAYFKGRMLLLVFVHHIHLLRLI